MTLTGTAACRHQPIARIRWAQASAPVIIVANTKTDDRQGRLSPPTKIPRSSPRHSRGLISVAPSRGANMLTLKSIPIWAAPAVQHLCGVYGHKPYYGLFGSGGVISSEPCDEKSFQATVSQYGRLCTCSAAGWISPGGRNDMGTGRDACRHQSKRHRGRPY
jgi:hypothetical protein